MRRIFNKTKTVFIATLAASGVATAVLAGCTGNESNRTANATEDKNSLTASNASYKGKTINGKVISLGENDIPI